MLDLIKEGIRLNQSLVLLPLKAARRLVNDKNTNAKQLLDIAEDFASIPFVAATKVVDGTTKSPHKGNTCQNKSNQTMGGPKFTNIFVNPEVTLFSDVETTPGERRAILNVTGLLCGG